MLTTILLLFALLLIFYLLAKISDQYFIKSLDIISNKLKLSEDVAGATFMAIGTSAPEFFTSVIALTKIGSENVGAGTIVGSAIFNILVIIGASSIVSTAFLSWKPVIRDISFYIITIVLLLITFIDGRITFTESLLYIIVYAVYIFVLANWKKISKIEEKMHKGKAIEHAMEQEDVILKKRGGIWRTIVLYIDKTLALFFPDLKKRPDLYIVTFIVSILLIVGLSYGLVEIAIVLAHTLGIPEVIIALTILAGGTSVPDLLASLIVSKQNRGDMAVSNAVGSNTFDILIGLGLPWLVYILITGNNVLVVTENLISSVFLLFFTVIAILFILIAQKFKIGRKAGLLLIFIYVLYLIYAVFTSLS
jgi:K+-dependent Na+/Ca+ exchanger-like protein